MSPSMLSSTRPRSGFKAAATSSTSCDVMCRASARGCTVMPGAPASTIVRTASRTLGTRPPRELRSVATLLTLTLRRTMAAATRNVQARCVRTADAISSAQPWISRWSLPSIMMRSSGSVPE